MSLPNCHLQDLKVSYVSSLTCKLSNSGGSDTGNVHTVLATGAFFLKGLGVGCIILHHYNCFLAALPQLGVCILYSVA